MTATVTTRRGVARWIVTGLLVLLLGGQVAPAEAGPPGTMTVAQWRSVLVMMEQKYDERAARAVAIFFADGAMSQEYLLSECLREQTVLEVREWLRNTAPPELTLLEALWLNAHQRGCQARAAEEMPSWPSGRASPSPRAFGDTARHFRA